jgi:hypothetical protein
MTSTIKVDNIQDQDGNNIINENANTITIGASGDTVTLASGASQSGFGRTGTVDWDTTKKTASFTAVSGNGYFVDTTSAAITVTLPASPSAGDIVAVVDYAGTSETNNITIARNSSNINGGTDNLTINRENAGIILVYVDATQGWKGTESMNLNDITLQPSYIAATGGTVTTCGNYKIHTFTSPGTFCVSCGGNSAGSNTVSYMVVAGGGGAGSNQGGNGNSKGGGGAGGYREGKASSDCYTASPLNAPAGLPVTAQAYPITVGGGGAGGPYGSNTPGSSGNNSIFSTITSAGGGFGAAGGGTAGGTGGSGGGYSSGPPGGLTSAGNTPPVSPPQGNPSGVNGSCGQFGGGGGGAGEAGNTDGVSAGGDGVASSINGTPTIRAGGGGGGQYGSYSPWSGAGGDGGGANGGNGTANNAGDGTANTGGGGGGTGANGACTVCRGGGTGGSGIVIIRYKFQ